MRLRRSRAPKIIKFSMLTHVLGGGDPLPPLHPNTCVSMENLVILGAREKTESFYLLCWLMYAACHELICHMYKLCAVQDVLCVYFIAAPMVYDVRSYLIR